MRSAALRTLESMLRPGDKGVYANETRLLLENADESLNCGQVCMYVCVYVSTILYQLVCAYAVSIRI